MGEYLKSDAVSERSILPKSDFAAAVNYIRNHWEQLQLYTTNGLIPIDNNDVEQLMKKVATGRKNSLFIGSADAGERAANLLTLVSTAHRNDLDVWMYLKDALDQLLAGSTDYESLRADVWKQSHPEAVRTYRSDERRDTADRNRLTRAQRRLANAKKLEVSVRGTHLVRRCSVPGIVRGTDSSRGDFFAAFLTIVAFAVGYLACLFDAMHQHQFRMSRSPVIRQHRGQCLTWQLIGQ